MLMNVCFAGATDGTQPYGLSGRVNGEFLLFFPRGGDVFRRKLFTFAENHFYNQSFV